MIEEKICVEYNDKIRRVKEARHKAIEKFRDEVKKFNTDDYEVNIYRSEICGDKEDMVGFALDCKYAGFKDIYEKILDKLNE